MKKDIIIATLLIIAIIQIGLNGDLFIARFKLLQNSKQEYIKNEFMCGQFSKQANQILQDQNIKSYSAISKEKDYLHSYILIAFDPENNKFYSPDDLDELVDICDIDNEKPKCLIGELNDELDFYEQ